MTLHVVEVEDDYTCIVDTSRLATGIHIKQRDATVMTGDMKCGVTTTMATMTAL